MERSLSVELIRGDAALDRLGDPGFVAGWERMRAACPWATSFQSTAFVEPWYRLHESLHEPVIAEGRDRDGRLVGILPLARRRTGRRLVGAGGIHAEYQGWLAMPDAAGTFAPAALDALERAFPRGGVSFNYLAPGTPTAWAGSEGGWLRRVRLATRQRGLMDLSDPSTIDASLRKGHNRSRMNTLRRVGEVELETITDVAELEAQIDEIAVLCDLRQGAVNDSLPFRNNPLKRPLHLALMERGLLHVTILRVGGAIASAHLDMRNGDEVLIYLIAHAPALARQSPGSLHILLLGRQLADLGIARYDLSPGTGYKDRYATLQEPIERMSVRFGVPGRISAGVSARAVATASRVLAATGRTPGGALAEARSIRARATAAVRRQPARDRPQGGYAVLELPHGTVIADAGLAVDRLADLLTYDPDRFGGLSLTRFLALSLHRLELGHHVMTRMEGNKLAECWWVAQPVLRSPEAGGGPPGPGNPAVVVYDPFLAPPARARPAVELLGRVRSTTAMLTPTAPGYLVLGGAEAALSAAMVRAGAVPVGQLRLSPETAVDGPGPDDLLEQLATALARAWRTGAGHAG